MCCVLFPPFSPSEVAVDFLLMLLNGMDSCCVCSISGIFSIRCNCCANVVKAARTGSPACRLGTVVEGGLFRIVTMSVAACRRWSVSVTDGKGITVGKKVTELQSLVALVRGK